MRKIIFLDFDGVMDTAFYDHFALKNGLPETDEYGCVFDPNCIMALNEIVKKTGASIVVSSTWKDFMTMEQLMKMWEDRCLPGEVIDVTPSISHHRGDEIDAWLKEYGKPCQYVIIDDMPFSEFNQHHQSHFIMTNGFDGLNDDLAERKAVVQKSVEDYVEFCKASAGIMPASWFSSFFENTQLLLDTNRESEDGNAV